MPLTLDKDPFNTEVQAELERPMVPPPAPASPPPPPAKEKPKKEKRDDRSDFMAGLKGSLLGGNLHSLGMALLGASQLTDNGALYDQAHKLINLGEQYTPKGNVESLGEVRTDSVKHFFGDLLDFVQYQLGAAAGSLAVPAGAGVATSAAVTAATGNPMVGSVAGIVGGIGGTFFVQNYGDMYGALVDSPGVAAQVKAGKLTPKDLAQVAALPALGMTALYTVGLEGTIGKAVFRRLGKTVARRIAQGAATGSLFLAGAGGVSAAMKEAVTAALGDKTPAADRAIHVIDATLGGAIGGAAIGPIGSARRTRAARESPAVKLHQAARAAQEQAPVAPTPTETAPAAPAAASAVPEAAPVTPAGMELQHTKDNLPFFAPKEKPSTGPMDRALQTGAAHQAAKAASELVPVGSQADISMGGAPPMRVTIDRYHPDGMDVTDAEGNKYTLPMDDPDFSISPVEQAKTKAAPTGEPPPAPEIGEQPTLNPKLAPAVPEGAARPFAPGEFVRNPDGSWSSELSATIVNPDLNNGKPTVIPTLWLKDGKPYVAKSEDEAVALAKASGLHFKSFKTLDDAEKFAVEREAKWQGIKDPKDASSVAPLWTEGEQPKKESKRKEVAKQAVEIGGEQTEHAASHRVKDIIEEMLEGSLRVSAANGRHVQVRPQVVEANELVTSADKGYDQSLQPRNRDRAVSDQQVRQIATNLEPERLGPSPEADRGAPIVGPDNMVESGNGRVAAIRQAYEGDTSAAKRYRNHLAAQGYDIKGFTHPVLIQRRVSGLTPDERRQFTVAANQPATLSMGASERAVADSKLFTNEDLDLITHPDNLAANRDFVRRFMSKLPTTEQGAMVTEDGGVSTEGLARVRNAILAKAYGDTPVLARISEATDDNIKSISNAMVAAAPAWAKLRGDVDAKAVNSDMDITPDLIEAVRRTADLRNKGISLENHLAQTDAFERIPRRVEALMRLFYDPTGKRAAGANRIVESLRYYTDRARKVQAGEGLDLGLPKVKPEDILNAAEQRRRQESQASLDLTRSTPGQGDQAHGQEKQQRPVAERNGGSAGKEGGGERAAEQRQGALKSFPEFAREKFGPDWQVSHDRKAKNPITRKQYNDARDEYRKLTGVEPYSDDYYKALRGESAAARWASLAAQPHLRKFYLDSADIKRSPETPWHMLGKAIQDKLAPIIMSRAPQFQPTSKEHLGEQAQAYVRHRGRETGNEHLVVFDDKGNVVEQAEGSKNTIKIAERLMEKMNDPKRALVAHHNHPRNTALSWADITQLGRPGMRAVFAHGHEGAASRAELTPAAKEAANGLAPTAAAERLGRVANKVYTDLFDPVRAKIAADHAAGRDTRLDVRDAPRFHGEVVNRILRDAGIIDYQSNLDANAFIDRVGLAPYIKAKAQEARSLYYGKDSGTLGAVGRVRAARELHPGEVGTIFDRTESGGVRGGRGADQAGNGETGGTSDRNPQRLIEASFREEGREFGRTGVLRRLPGDTKQFTEFVKGLPEDLRSVGLGLLPLRALPDWTKNQPAVKSYVGVEHEMRTYRNKMHEKSDALANEWRRVVSKIGQRSAAALSDLMHQSTLAGIDPSKTNVGNRAKAGYADLRRMYDNLPPAARAVFNKVRDLLRDQSKEYDKVLLDRIGRAMDRQVRDIERRHAKETDRIRTSDMSDEAKRKAQATADRTRDRERQKATFGKASRLNALRLVFEKSRGPEPYFPLARFGQYFLTVRDKNGKVLSFSRRETAGQMNTLETEMRRAFPGAKIETGVLPKVDARSMVDPRSIAEVSKVLGDAGVDNAVMDQIWQRYLDTLPDLSIRKHFIHRKGVPGFHRDALRSFANHSFHIAHQIARLRYGDVLGDLVERAQEQAGHNERPIAAGKIANELAARHDWIMNPTSSTWGQHATTLGFLWYLGASPASAIVNLSQTVMLGVPVLGSRYGEGRAIAALGKASKDYIAGKGGVRGGNLSPSEVKAIDDLYDRGTIDETRAHDLAGLSEGGTQYNPTLNKVVQGLSFLFHQAERFNREVTALAAYRLARDAGLTHADAVDRAAEHTWTVHFDYNGSNRPRFMQERGPLGTVARPLLLFKNFQLNMFYRLFRDAHQTFAGESPQVRRQAARQLAGIMGMMALGAGTLGVPFMQQVVIPTWGWFFGDPNDEKSSKSQFRDAVLETLGPQLGGMVLDGVPGYVTGTSLTNRLGMPDLWFQSQDRIMDAQDWWHEQVEQLAGPMLQMVHNVYNGFQVIKDGKGTARGIEMMMPTAAKNLMRAWRYANEGVLNLRGDPVAENVDFGDVLKQAIGFTPARVAEGYALGTEKKNIERTISDKRRDLLTEWNKAVESGDKDDQASVLDDIKAFNAVPIHAPRRITAKTLNKSIRQRRRLSNKAEHGVIIQNRQLNEMINRALPPKVY